MTRTTMWVAPTTGRKALWGTLIVLGYTVVLTTISYGFCFQDYFQDWASARNWWEGIPTYSSHTVTVPRYLNVEFDRLAEGREYAMVATVKLNAHPPSSILFYLPFALLSYGSSYFVWNLTSALCLVAALAMVARELKIPPSPWHLLWLVPLAAFNGPLFQNMIFGQSATVILAILALAWVAHRRGWPVVEGCCLGAAAAFKLFPLLLLMIPLAGRRWRSVGAAVATIGIAFGLSVLVFGGDIWAEYARTGLREAVVWGDLWPNVSLSGFWRKLFVSQNKGIGVGDWSSPAGFWIGYGISLGGVGVTTVALIALRGWRSRGDMDGSYAIGISAMLLMSPTCWPHYFVLLLVSVAILWQQAPALRKMLLVCLIPALTPDSLFPILCGLDLDTSDCAAGPLATLTFLAMQTYALLGLWAVGVTHEIRTLFQARHLSSNQEQPGAHRQAA